MWCGTTAVKIENFGISGAWKNWIGKTTELNQGESLRWATQVERENRIFPRGETCESDIDSDWDSDIDSDSDSDSDSDNDSDSDSDWDSDIDSDSDSDSDSDCDWQWLWYECPEGSVGYMSVSPAPSHPLPPPPTPSHPPPQYVACGYLIVN